jgi:hypothetical protein
VSTPTDSQLRSQYENASSIGLRTACREAEAKYDLPPGLMLAIASRETNMRNINGDGGHGRGVFQIDDRYHQPFLRKHGSPPPVAEAAMYAASLIASNMKYAKEQGVPEKDRLRVAVAGYNAGMGGAMSGYRAGAVDSRTTGDDYSKDVFARRSAIVKFLPTAVDGPKGDRAPGRDNGNRHLPGPIADDKKGPKDKPASSKGPGEARRGLGQRIVLHPDKMRAAASFLDRTGNALERDATLVKTQASKPAMPPNVRANVLAEIAGIQFRLRALASGAETHSEDLRKRANRVDEPASSGSRKPGKGQVSRRPMLARGATGAMVKSLQRLLNKLGFGPLDVDGIFGPLTQAAVTRFQRAKKLGADGVVGPKTWAALLGGPARSSAAPAPAPAPVGSGFGAKLVSIARGQKGVDERGWNVNKFSQWAGRPAEPWCADFVSWTYAQAGKPVGPGGKGYAGVAQWIDYFKAQGDWHTAPRIGAAVMFDWRNGGMTTDHIGIVTRIEGDKVFYISGNTGGPGGEGVYEKSVPTQFVSGYGWPPK